MFQHIVVPVDDSEAAWRAVPIAARMAAHVDGKLDVISVVDRLDAVETASANLRIGVDALGDLPVDPRTEVLAHDSVAAALAAHLETRNGAVIVMSSHGHGRSASVLGSVADDIVRATFGPIVVVGPHVRSDAGSLEGPYVVPLDGSSHGDMILPIAAAWSVEFGAEPWLVEVLPPGVTATSDVVESAYIARRARQLQREIGREVEFEVLHHDDPAQAITDFAIRSGASLIFCTTHGRTGLARLRAGSVAARMIRTSTCPVVLFRPPRLDAA
jgi:nucleotide-binding universal stress UspA family protein